MFMNKNTHKKVHKATILANKKFTKKEILFSKLRKRKLILICFKNISCIIVFKNILDADDCMSLADIAVLFKEKPATMIIKENEALSMSIKIHNQIMTLDNDAFSVYAEETEDLKCDSFFLGL
jgi:hypothetical protein